jgi:RNA polymerase sigma-70 factor, ECF subfamily
LQTLSEQEESAEQLVARAQTGCLLAYERLVVLFQDRLFTYLGQLLGNDQDAEDVAQDAFIKAYQHLATFDGRSRFSTWLYAIAKNTAYNHLRRRRYHVPIEDLADVLPAVELPRAVSDGESIWALARQLKPKFYETLWLFYAEGFSLKEVSEITGTNAITVRVNLHRARAALGKKLRRYEAVDLARVTRSL